MKGIYSIALLIAANVFMTLAWYGHLKYSDNKKIVGFGLIFIILISWGIAFFEYCLQVPANRIGYEQNGGPFTLLQLKIIQEVVSLIVFVIFSLLLFKTESLKWNHLVGMVFLVLAVYFVFKK